jgi:arylsulfatase/uncharacterized sulfatase
MKKIWAFEFVAAVFLLCVPVAAGGAQKAPKAPNIVLLVGDDWGFSDVGAFGSEIRTPNIDALARSGMKFSNFHVAATCSPTRAMLLTGVDNHRNGLGAMDDLMPEKNRGKPGYLGYLSNNAITVAQLLKDNGYHTYATGKWHLGHKPGMLPPSRGFERSFIQAHGSSDNWEQKPWIFIENSEWFDDGKQASLPQDYYSSKFITDKAIEYIAGGAKDGKPFFAYVAYQAVHIPVQAPKEFSHRYRGMYDLGWNALREARRHRAIALGLIPKDTKMVNMATTVDWNSLPAASRVDQARRMEVYAGMAEAMDFHVGRLIDHLKKTGAYDNTVFLFLSDNGAEAADPYENAPLKWWIKANWTDKTERLGEKGAYSFIGPGWASAAVSPLSTYKQWAGEGALRTPLIVSGVAGMSAQSLNKNFVHVTDIAPTLVELAGIIPHQGRYQGRDVEPMRGNSLLAVLQGKSKKVHPADQPVGYELQGNSALFRGDYKIVRNLPPVGDGEWHLYDIVQDPGEVLDLRIKLPSLYQEMLQDYAAYVRNNQVLTVPQGYDYRKQALNYALTYWLWPKIKWYLLFGTIFLVTIYCARNSLIRKRVRK